MAIAELFILFHPVIDILGTLAFVGLIFGSTLFAIVWFIRKTWKIIMAAGVAMMILIVLQLTLMVP